MLSPLRVYSPHIWESPLHNLPLTNKLVALRKDNALWANCGCLLMGAPLFSWKVFQHCTNIP